MEKRLCFTKYSIRRKKSDEIMTEKYKGEFIIGNLLHSDPIKYCTECQDNTCRRHYMIGNKHYRCVEDEEEF